MPRGFEPSRGENPRGGILFFNCKINNCLEDLNRKEGEQNARVLSVLLLRGYFVRKNPRGKNFALVII